MYLGKVCDTDWDFTRFALYRPLKSSEAFCMPWGKAEMKYNYNLPPFFFLAKDDVSGFQVQEGFWYTADYTGIFQKTSTEWLW